MRSCLVILNDIRASPPRMFKSIRSKRGKGPLTYRRTDSNGSFHQPIHRSGGPDFSFLFYQTGINFFLLCFYTTREFIQAYKSPESYIKYVCIWLQIQGILYWSMIKSEIWEKIDRRMMDSGIFQAIRWGLSTPAKNTFRWHVRFGLAELLYLLHLRFTTEHLSTRFWDRITTRENKRCLSNGPGAVAR